MFEILSKLYVTIFLLQTASFIICVSQARIIVAEKNSDELFQNFIWHTTAADYSAAKQDPNDVVPVTGQQLKKDKDQGISSSFAFIPD